MELPAAPCLYSLILLHPITSGSDSIILKLPFCSSLSVLFICVRLYLNDPRRSLWYSSLPWHVLPSGLQLLITPISKNSKHNNTRISAVLEVAFEGKQVWADCPERDWLNTVADSTDRLQGHMCKAYGQWVNRFLRGRVNVCGQSITGSVWNRFEFPCGMLGSAVWMHLKTHVSPTHRQCLNFLHGHSCVCSLWLPHILTLHSGSTCPADAVNDFCLTCSLVSLQMCIPFVLVSAVSFSGFPSVRDPLLLNKYFCLSDLAYSE